jgi:hypothetical protein
MKVRSKILNQIQRVLLGEVYVVQAHYNLLFIDRVGKNAHILNIYTNLQARYHSVAAAGSEEKAGWMGLGCGIARRKSRMP